ELLPPGEAVRGTQGEPHSLRRPLRQLGQEPQQPRPGQGGPLGRSNLGRDDDRLDRGDVQGQAEGVKDKTPLAKAQRRQESTQGGKRRGGRSRSVKFGLSCLSWRLGERFFLSRSNHDRPPEALAP